MIEIDKKIIKNFSRPYMIAEIGSNHNGDMRLARKLIDAAKAAGCDCAKFQAWSKKSLFSRKAYENNPVLEKEIDLYSVSKDDLLELSDYCRLKGIDFSSSVFSNSEADLICDQLNAPFVKIASMDLNNYPLLEYVAGKHRPIILSTGLGTLNEIEKAVELIKREGNNQIVLLHCVSLYPPKDEQIHLNNIDMLRNKFPEIPVGFSDHTMGITISIAAICKGACVIEKHFTLDRQMEGWDHAISLTPPEMRCLVEEGERIVKALGSFQRVLEDEDHEKVRLFRRSIVAAKDIPVGKKIGRQDLDLKRPGTGITPEKLSEFIGRVTKRVIAEDALLNEEDLEC